MARILLINYEFPPLGGGAANATDNTARELAALGEQVLVLTSAFGDLPRVERRADGVEIRRIPTLRRRRDRSSVVEMLAFLASSLAMAPWIAARWRPDATIAYFGLPCGPAAWMVKALSGVPYVVSLRGGDVPGFQYDGISLYHRLAGPVIGWLWRRSSAVVANSEGLADLARRFAPDQPVAIIPNGVDAVRFSPAGAGPVDAGNDGDRLSLLFVGRVVRQKGLDVLFEALASLPSGTRGRIGLTIVGDGPARPELEAQAARLGLSERVAFRGWLGRDELPAAYRAADAFVFPSRDEGMPNVVLEAMAAGLPVVATRIAGNRDLVVEEETGLMLDADDTPALAAALARLAEDPALRRRLGEGGRRRVVEHFSWRAVAAAYRDLSLAGSKAAERGRSAQAE
ncbi:glycosyltransferase family 4 protein (plasmid) [Azospirillum humicireducens]|uniref:Glycosyltransferase family 4 protein n=1 Tax=Azospirillum humicireducens TaxID=1226968 RepID=A0A2R4VUT1_9PROT|nr:glycosyltransferase family 4 protein [Azospirillum humicireducens]AWB08199.1 glycosyltransferase family 4 protein [Azospirillum humicireducens]